MKWSSILVVVDLVARANGGVGVGCFCFNFLEQPPCSHPSRPTPLTQYHILMYTQHTHTYLCGCKEMEVESVEGWRVYKDPKACSQHKHPITRGKITSRWVLAVERSLIGGARRKSSINEWLKPNVYTRGTLMTGFFFLNCSCSTAPTSLCLSLNSWALARAVAIFFKSRLGFLPDSHQAHTSR